MYAWGNDRIGWLVTGTNNVLYHMWDDSTGRHGWENLGGYLTVVTRCDVIGQWRDRRLCARRQRRPVAEGV